MTGELALRFPVEPGTVSATRNRTGIHPPPAGRRGPGPSGKIIILNTKQYTLTCGSMVLGGLPRVVGTASSSNALDIWEERFGVLLDLLELRVDLLPAEADWEAASRRIEGFGTPTLVTIRHRMEGGQWGGREEERWPLFQRAVGAASLVDIEGKSKLVGEVCRMALDQGKVPVVSHHDFHQTPPLARLVELVEKSAGPGRIVKVATMIKDEYETELLGRLLQRDWGCPLCVIGMGEAGSQSRVVLALMGSCLTYGFVQKSAAPGQVSCYELVSSLRVFSPLYHEDYLTRHSILELP